MDSNSRKKARTSSETPQAKSFSRPWKSSDLVLKVADREFHVHRAVLIIGVRAGGARGAAAPPHFGRLRFFGQQEKIWAKPVFNDVSMFFLLL